MTSDIEHLTALLHSKAAPFSHCLGDKISAERANYLPRILQKISKEVRRWSAASYRQLEFFLLHKPFSLRSFRWWAVLCVALWFGASCCILSLPFLVNKSWKQYFAFHLINMFFPQPNKCFSGSLLSCWNLVACWCALLRLLLEKAFLNLWEKLVHWKNPRVSKKYFFWKTFS